MSLRRMDSLRKGDQFTSADGGHYTYDRVDGALSGVHHVTEKGGRQTMFAGCAEVEMGWNELGWFAKEREAARASAPLPRPKDPRCTCSDILPWDSDYCVVHG